jgi:hypothetical protein
MPRSWGLVRKLHDPTSGAVRLLEETGYLELAAQIQFLPDLREQVCQCVSQLVLCALRLLNSRGILTASETWQRDDSPSKIG